MITALILFPVTAFLLLCLLVLICGFGFELLALLIEAITISVALLFFLLCGVCAACLMIGRAIAGLTKPRRTP